MIEYNNCFRKVDNTEFNTHLKNVNIYGFSIIKNYFKSELINELINLINKEYEQSNNTFKGRPERDVDDKMIYNLQNKNNIFINILDTEVIRKIAIEKLNDKYFRWIPETEPNYILHYYNARSGGKKLDLHIDTYFPFISYQTIAMQFVFVLNNMDENNGCTVVVPGSHMSGQYTDREIEEKKSILANPGDLVFWDSRLWHGTKENKNKKDRWIIIATLSQWWVKQAMDIPKSLPDSIYENCTEREKVLLGFCSIPPKDEHERINTKSGYDSIKKDVSEYR